MPLREILKNIVENVSGGIGSVVMGYDGIPIDEYVDDGSDMDVSLLAVEYATVMKEIKKTVDVLKIGNMEETTINTESLRVIIRVIDEDLFVVLVISSDGNFGKGRYFLKLMAPKLREFLL